MNQEMLPFRTGNAKIFVSIHWVQVQVHLFTLIQLQYNNNKKKKNERSKKQS